MDYLLDTHTFLWTVFEPKKLSESAHDCISNSENRIVVSAITFWEISLKSAIGKLELIDCSPDDLPRVAKQMGLKLLPLEADIAAGFHRLPPQPHKDPFDRMLIWLAIRKHLVLITKDKAFDAYAGYGLQTIW